MVAPRPAPAATPEQVGVGQRVAEHALVATRRPGRASRRRARPAPPVARGSPTGWWPRARRAASQRRLTGNRDSRSPSTASAGMPAGPSVNPANRAATSAITPPASHRQDRPPALPWPSVRADGVDLSDAYRRDAPGHVGHPVPCAVPMASATASTKSGTRGPHREAMSSSITTTPPFWTAVSASQPGRSADLLGGDSAALVVGQEHQIGIGREQVLGRDLRVGRAGLLGGLVGDVGQAEVGVDLTDERVAARGVQVGVRARGTPTAGGPSGSPRSPSRSGLHVRDDAAASSPWPVAAPMARSAGRRRRGRQRPTGRSRGRQPVQAVGELARTSPEASTRSGRYSAIASTFGSKPESSVTGASAGKSDWSSTATTCSPAPIANSVSVAVGDSDTIWVG